MAMKTKRPTLVKGKAVWTEGKLAPLDPKRLVADIRKLSPGDGESFVIVVQREADAKALHQLRWYWGYVVKQISEETGYDATEVDGMLRGLFLPPDVETLSLLSYEQMQDYTKRCEEYAASTIGVVIAGPHDARQYAA